MHNPEFIQENETHKLLGQTTRPSDSQQKKKTCRIVDSMIPVDHRAKLKGREIEVKYIDLSRGQRKLWNMKVIPTVIGALGTVTRGLVQGLEDLKIRG